MRQYITLVESSLTEAQNYEQMFTKFLTNYPKPAYIDFIKTNIGWAKKTLRKNDRIVWYLNVIKAEALPDMENGIDIAQVMSRFRHYRNTIQHLIAIEATPIQNYIFPAKASFDEVRDTLENFEEQWKRTRHQYIKVNEDDKPILRLPGGFEWVLLNRKSCRAEADAMGHCGNSQTIAKEGQRILSLRHRERTSGGEQWRPSLTFILNPDGSLGEMKGRGNTKPSRTYHPHIIALLKSNIVTTIKGGGHDADNNFDLNDLDEDARDDLLRIKPELINIGVEFKKKWVEATTHFGASIILSSYLDYVEEAIHSSSSAIYTIDVSSVTATRSYTGQDLLRLSGYSDLVTLLSRVGKEIDKRLEDDNSLEVDQDAIRKMKLDFLDSLDQVSFKYGIMNFDKYEVTGEMDDIISLPDMNHVVDLFNEIKAAFQYCGEDDTLEDTFQVDSLEDHGYLSMFYDRDKKKFHEYLYNRYDGSVVNQLIGEYRILLGGDEHTTPTPLNNDRGPTSFFDSFAGVELDVDHLIQESLSFTSKT